LGGVDDGKKRAELLMKLLAAPPSKVGTVAVSGTPGFVAVAQPASSCAIVAQPTCESEHMSAVPSADHAAATVAEPDGMQVAGADGAEEGAASAAATSEAVTSEAAAPLTEQAAVAAAPAEQAAPAWDEVPPASAAAAEVAGPQIEELDEEEGQAGGNDKAEASGEEEEGRE